MYLRHLGPNYLKSFINNLTFSIQDVNWCFSFQKVTELNFKLPNLKVLFSSSSSTAAQIYLVLLFFSPHNSFRVSLGKGNKTFSVKDTKYSKKNKKQLFDQNVMQFIAGQTQRCCFEELHIVLLFLMFPLSTTTLQAVNANPYMFWFLLGCYWSWSVWILEVGKLDRRGEMDALEKHKDKD